MKLFKLVNHVAVLVKEKDKKIHAEKNYYLFILKRVYWDVYYVRRYFHYFTNINRH